MSGSTVSLPTRVVSHAPLRALPDRALVRLAARGNQAAFAAIFERHHQALFRYAAGILRNRDEARDAVQSTMVRLLGSLPGEERTIELRPWLFRIAHNETISIIRRRSPTVPPESGPEPATDAGLDSKLQAKAIVDDLRSLPERQRSAVVMRELNGLSYAEIGAAFGINSTAAKQAVYEGRIALRELERGREMSCRQVCESISDGDRRRLRGRGVRAHLRSCADCRAFAESIETRRASFGAIAPMPAALGAQLLAKVLGVGGGAGPGGGLAAGGGAAASSALGATQVAGIGGLGIGKIAAGLAVVAATGVGLSSGGSRDAGAEQSDASTTPTSRQAAGPAQAHAADSNSSANAGRDADARLVSEQERGEAGEDNESPGGGRGESDDERAGNAARPDSGGPGNGNGPPSDPGSNASPSAQGNGPPDGSMATPPGPSGGQSVAAANQPVDPGNSASHAEAPADPPGLVDPPDLPDLPGPAGPKPK